MSAQIPGSEIKFYSRHLCGGVLVAPYCMGNPKDFNIDQEYSLMRSFIPDFMVDERQPAVELCRGFKRILEGKSEKERLCADVSDEERPICKERMERLIMINEECNRRVLKYHEKIEEFRGWIWGTLGGLGAFLVAIIIRFFNRPKGARDVVDEAFRAIEALRNARGTGGRLKAFWNGLYRIYSRYRGESIAEEDKIKESAEKNVSQEWGVVRGLLASTQEKLNNFLLNLEESEHPDKASDLQSVNLSFLMGGERAPTVAALHQRFFSDAEQILHSYQKTIWVIEKNLPSILAGHFLPVDRIPTEEELDLARKETERFREAVVALLDANRGLRGMVNQLASAFVTDPTFNANWLHTILATETNMEKALRQVDGNLSLIEQIGLHRSYEDRQSWSLRLLRIYHGMGTASGMMSKVLGFKNHLAKKLGVRVEMTTAETDLAIPQEIQIDLFKILNTLLDNAINFSDPARRGSDAMVEFSSSVSDDNLTFTVKDNGVGFRDPASAMGGKRERPDMAPGLGIELKAAHELAEKAGLIMTYKHLKSYGLFNAGTEFQVTIPAKLQSLGMQTPQGTPIPGPVQGGTGMASSAMIGLTQPFIASSLSFMRAPALIMR
ncbi:MAG TPA: ATP-binding protein [bacterium]|nr:MAG: Histidine kinase-, DNA gyrase B-, and HSP90-like ATPase [bacterium ADurb.Bin270]HPW45693.1 ATP-binding protein [bacterium]